MCQEVIKGRVFQNFCPLLEEGSHNKYIPLSVPWHQSFFKFYIYTAESDQVAETDIEANGDEEECTDASFFQSNPVAKDLGLDGSEGMLQVNDMLSRANSVTLNIIMSGPRIFIEVKSYFTGEPKHFTSKSPTVWPPSGR